MKFNVDISIFSSPISAYGNVTGLLEFPTAPLVGDSVSFMFSKNKIPMPEIGFNGILLVKERIFNMAVNDEILISLEDVVLEGESRASAFMDYLEEGFDLFGIRYGEQ